MANAQNGLAHRLGALEERAMVQRVRQEAERIADLVGADPEWLVKRSVEIAALVAIHGPERTLELVAHGIGTTAEDLEASAARLEPGAI